MGFSNVLEIHLEDASGPILKHFPKKVIPIPENLTILRNYKEMRITWVILN